MSPDRTVESLLLFFVLLTDSHGCLGQIIAESALAAQYLRKV